MPNPGPLAIALFEASAFLILLVLNHLLSRDLSARFIRLWRFGWLLLVTSGLAQIVSLASASPFESLLARESRLAAILFFLAAVLDYAGGSRWLGALFPVGALGAISVALAARRPPGATIDWVAALGESSILLASGWIVWRHTRGKGTYGGELLAAAFWLRGLHGMDRPAWPGEPTFLLRMAFDGFLAVALGIAMAVLILEATRARTEELNDKLRRLSLVTAASAQSMNASEVLSEVLEQLVESLGATHGLVRRLIGEGDGAQLELRAAVGFTPVYMERHRRLSAREQGERRVLEQETPYLTYQGDDPKVGQRMEAEGVSSAVLVRLPGKDVPLGILGIGSATPRRFQSDEINFVTNAANLLGLTLQSVGLVEQVVGAQRQWVNTFDSIGDPIVVHDRQCRILRANQALSNRLGIAPRLLVGRFLSEVLRHNGAAWSRCPYCEGAAGKGDDFDPSLGGHFLASNSEFQDASGQPQGTVHVLKDITERKRAEEKYRHLFENVQEGVFISTPEGRFLDFNDAFMRMLGYSSREELLRVDITSAVYVDPADRERLKKILREHGSVTDFEFPMRRRDGEILTVLETSFVTRDSSGAATAYQGFVLDITERKRAEQEVRRRNRELTVLNSIGQSLNQSLELEDLLSRALRQVTELFTVDTAGIYLLNEKTNAVRRVAAVGLRSEYARHFPETQLPAALMRDIRESHATVLPAQSLPLPALLRDVQRKEGIQVAHAVVLWSKESIIGALVVGSRTLREFAGAELNLLAAVGAQFSAAIERTLLYEETRRAYEDLRRTQEQLLHSGKMAAVGQLVSGVAHELNNPLTAILGYAQVLSEGGHVTERGAAYLAKLYKQAQRTHRIVRNLLSFSRQQKPERQPVQINQILEDTLALREYDLKLNNIQIHRRLAADLPLTAADPHQFQQVFLNILNNAVDAVQENPSRGQIWVRTGVEGGQLLVEFTDSGPGVKDPTRVFDPFYTTKPVGRGTGLGLSICYGIVTEHGGEILVSNSTEKGRGAIFTIRLPILGARETAGAAPTMTNGALASGNVLLVDDEESLLELEEKILTQHGLRVRSVHSGRDAQLFLQCESVDVVVMDLKMPGEVSGRALYNWIRGHDPELARRVVFTVSDANGKALYDLPDSSGCQFLQKPFELEKLLEAVLQALARLPSTETLRR